MLKRSWIRTLMFAILIAALVVPVAAGAQTATGITSPTDGATLSGTVEVVAKFPGSPYVRWDLFILPGGSDAAGSG